MKTIKTLIPVIFLILSIVIMEGGFYFKTIGKGGNIPEILNGLENDINDDNWDDATTKTNEIQSIFINTTKIIQYSVERDEIFEFNIHLAKLEGHIKEKDTSNSISEIYILKKFWDDLGR